MLEKIHHWLTGAVRLTVTGDPARFLAAASRWGLSLWDLSRREGGAVLSCRAGQYRRLRPLAKRCGVRIRLERKWGLPFLTLPLRRRVGLLVGIPCGVAVFWFLSGFVWGVSVTGAQTLGDGVILAAAARGGVSVGVRRDSFSPKVAAHGLVEDLPELTWASVNTDGCFVEVAVQEGEAAPEIVDNERWSNIVAARAGTVTAIEAQRGRPEVRLGDTVEEGDLLIAGSYWEKLDPWGPQRDPLRTVGPARGRVEARTYREFTIHVSARRTRMVPVERRVRLSLELFGWRIPLNWAAAPREEASGFVTVQPLKALGVTLPVAIRREVWDIFEEETVTLTQAELETAALWKLRQAQRADLPPGSQVEREELEWAFPDGMCLLTARCNCREDIALERVVLGTRD